MTELVPVSLAPLMSHTPDLAEEIRVGWLLRCRSRHTRVAYEADFKRWARFLAAGGVPVLAATMDHVSAYQRVCEQEVNPRTGQPLTNTTVARRVAAVSSYYKHACRRGVLAGNPAMHVDRPEVDPQHSETADLTEDEARRLIQAGELLAERATTNRSRVAAVRDAAMVVVMLCTGGRVSEVTSALVEDLGRTRGHRVLYVTRKGGKRQALPLGEAARVVDRYVNGSGRTTGPLFITNRGRSVDRAHVFRAVRKTALAADLPAELRLSPHGLRHTFATLSFDGGAALYDVQDAMGHASASTTQRYDRGRGRIDRSPVHQVSRTLLGAEPRPGHDNEGSL